MRGGPRKDISSRLKYLSYGDFAEESTTLEAETGRGLCGNGSRSFCLAPFKNTFYFGLTNGSLLYLPTKEAFAEGGYEPNVSPFTNQAEADFAPGVKQYLQRLGRP